MRSLLLDLRRARDMAREENFDLINLDGPLSVESILKTLQQRFMEGHCYVSGSLSLPF